MHKKRVLTPGITGILKDVDPSGDSVYLEIEADDGTYLTRMSKKFPRHEGMTKKAERLIGKKVRTLTSVTNNPNWDPEEFWADIQEVV